MREKDIISTPIYFIQPVLLWYWLPVKTGSASFHVELQIYAAEGKIRDDPLQSAMLTSNLSGTIHDVEIHF